jgi:HD-like signal output (HDOD) protein
MRMSSWLISILAIVAVLAALAVFRRRRRVPEQGAALRVAATAAPEPAPAESSIPAPPAPAEDPGGVTPADALNVRAETMRALKEVALDTTLPSAALAPPPDELCARVAATLVNIVDKPNYAPRRPMQLPRLMQAINDETASRGALSQIIAGDPALAGNLLRLANSPYYRHSPEPIESLDRAVSMLGTEGLRSMIAAALLQPVFRVSGGSFAHFGEVAWEHSVYAAGAAESHAALAEGVDPFAAQLLALIMGLATIVVFSVAQDEFLAGQRKPDAAVIAALIDAHAVGVARQIAASWELSERIDTALAEQADLQILPGGTAGSALGRALQFGEYMGALAVLRSRGQINDQTAAEILKTVPAPPAIAARIWARLGFTPD